MNRMNNNNFGMYAMNNASNVPHLNMMLNNNAMMNHTSNVPSHNMMNNNAMMNHATINNNVNTSSMKMSHIPLNNVPTPIAPMSTGTSNVDMKKEELNPLKRKYSEISDGTTSDEPDPEFKLKPSKSPIIDALVYCALKGWGINMECISDEKILFKVTDFHKYYKHSNAICSKLNPTDDIGSRIKTLQRWFGDFPSSKEISKGQGQAFNISIQNDSDKFNKVKEIIEMRQMEATIVKKRRTK